MKTEQEQRQAIRQILFDANDICQATPCENEYCIYHGDYRCYDNVIVDKLINAGYGDVTEYKSEIERLRQEVRDTDKMARNSIEQYKNNYDNAFERLKAQEREIERLKAEKKQAQIDVLKKLRSRISDKETLIQSYIADGCLTIGDMYTEIDELIKEVENDK